jgi:ABC-type Mn2+/Zn2+ transport system permease subunit
MFEYAFFQRAFVAGVLSGGVCGALSVYIVSKRMAFIGEGIAHAAFGGISLGLLLGISPMPTAAVFAIAMAVAISLLSKKGDIQRDTLIGILLSVSMALGVIFLSFARTYTGAIMAFLFGNILAVKTSDLYILIGVTLLIALYLSAFYKELKFYAFDERMARIYGIPVGWIEIGLLSLIALAVIASVQIVGVILVTAFLVVPGAIALLFARSFGALIAISCAVGILAAITGLILSYYLDIPSGATIALLSGVSFLILKIVKR